MKTKSKSSCHISGGARAKARSKQGLGSFLAPQPLLEISAASPSINTSTNSRVSGQCRQLCSLPHHPPCPQEALCPRAPLTLEPQTVCAQEQAHHQPPLFLPEAWGESNLHLWDERQTEEQLPEETTGHSKKERLRIEVIFQRRTGV